MTGPEATGPFAMVGLEIKRNIKATTIISILLTFISHLLFLIYSPNEKSDRKLNHLLFRVIFLTEKEGAKEISSSAALPFPTVPLNKSSSSL
jgi:hypothetical protein